jgi:hypothetical protein
LLTEGTPTVTIHAYPLLNAPALRQPRFRAGAAQPFGAVVAALRRKLRVKDAALWCYVGSFVPAMDEGVGALWKVRFSGFDGLFCVTVRNRAAMMQRR